MCMHIISCNVSLKGGKRGSKRHFQPGFCMERDQDTPHDGTLIERGLSQKAFPSPHRTLCIIWNETTEAPVAEVCSKQLMTPWRIVFMNECESP